MTAVKRQSTGDHIVGVAGTANDAGSKYLMGGTVVEAAGTVDAVPSGAGLPVIQPAADASVRWLGVALKDAVVLSSDPNAATTDAYGFPLLDVSIPERTTTVERHGVYFVTYTNAAVNFRDNLCAAAGGKVRKWVTGTDKPEAIIGWCAEPGGVSASGGVYRAQIN